MPTLLFNLLIGFMIPGIDVWCHIGGLIGGVLISMGIGLGDLSKKQDRINGIIVLLLMFIFMGYIIMTK
jgi:rhomboid protease GluP